MRFSILFLLIASSLPALATFFHPEQEVHLSAGQLSTTVVFEADNNIKKAKPLCDCTTLRIEGKKLIAQVDTSKFDKNVDKQIDATTEDGKHTRLTMSFRVPAAIEFSARSITWKQGSTPTPQVLYITLPQGSPIHQLKEAALSGDQFDYVPKREKDGRHFSVTITPKNTTSRVLNRLIITTDSSDPRFNQHIIYLQIKK